MSATLVLVAALVAGAAAATTLVRRAWARQRGGSGSSPAAPPGSFAELPLAPGDIVQVGAQERWLRAAVVASEGTAVRCAIFFAPEAGHATAVVAFARPRRELLWFEAREAQLPASPPSRLELGRLLLDRVALLPVELRRYGPEAPQVGPSGKLALYAGAGTEAAAVLVSGQVVRLWVGRRIEPGGYDRLGNVDPDEGGGPSDLDDRLASG
ncbi:MAG: hypothetical protein HY744_31360 [Deltaproteobacteria bacterium]|nr:hypothetical protein [Deltaproteobacteria bacterium]